jgi:TatA/E family protein of Tat protein translocase
MPFNIGPGELILILIIALVVLGPGKLPEVASSLGKSLREFRKAATDVSDAARVDAPAPQAIAAPQAAPAPQPAPVAQAVAAPPAAPATQAAPVAQAAPLAPAPNTLAESAEPNTLATSAEAATATATEAKAPDSSAS